MISSPTEEILCRPKGVKLTSDERSLNYCRMAEEGEDPFNCHFLCGGCMVYSGMSMTHFKTDIKLRTN